MNESTSLSQTLPVPLEVVLKNVPDRTVGYACSRCGALFVLSKNMSDDERKDKYIEASQHCIKTCGCGEPLENCYRLRCKGCMRKLADEKEKVRFEKSTKITLEQYDADYPFYWEGHVGDFGDGYFSSLDALLDYCEQEGVDVPTYVWSCAPREFRLKADDWLERELENQGMYEDAGEDIRDDARQRLQSYLDVWAGEVNLRSWQVDYKRSVSLKPDDDAVQRAG